MERSACIVTYLNVAIRYILSVTTKHYLRFIISPYVCGIFVAIVWPNIALGTTIVAIIDAEQYRIVLGADSLVSGLEQRWGQAVEHYSACKIVVTPNCVVATAGLTFSHRFTFDLHRIAREACGGSGDLRDKADAFTKQALRAVRTLSQQILKVSPAIHGKTFKPGQDIVQAVFSGVQDRRLSLLGRALFVDGDRTIASQKFDAIMNRSTPYTVLGQNEAIIDYMRTDPDWNQDDTVNIVKKLLDMEVRARPTLWVRRSRYWKLDRM